MFEGIFLARSEDEHHHPPKATQPPPKNKGTTTRCKMVPEGTTDRRTFGRVEGQKQNRTEPNRTEERSGKAGKKRKIFWGGVFWGS